MNHTDAPYIFHAFDVSYFSAKVRPALRYKKLWFEEVRADGREIKRRTGLNFIPILITPEDETWQDTSEILDRLEERHPAPPLFPQTPLQRIAAYLVELYADEFGVIPAMHYRWGSELGERTARAHFLAMIGDEGIAKVAGDAMASARLAVGATDATASAIEEHTGELLAALSAHFAANPYLLGGRMSFADCALMGPVRGHLFFDMVSRQLLLDSAPAVCGWVKRCDIPVSDRQEAWLPDDTLAPTLMAVLDCMGGDAVPIELGVVEMVENWLDENRGAEKVPRGVGMLETKLRGVPLQRSAQPYSLWMLQRTLDAVAALSAEDRAKVEQAFASSPWRDILSYRPRHRLTKVGFHLALAD